jgi:hypothetical protein
MVPDESENKKLHDHDVELAWDWVRSPLRHAAM